MIKIHGKDYMMVWERIPLLHEKYGDNLSIKTEIVLDDKESIIMKATIIIFKKDLTSQKFTGHAQEYKNSTQINSTSAYENCETSALGRACAIANIGLGTSISSAEEVQNAIHQQKNIKIDHNFIPIQNKDSKYCGKQIHELDIECLEWIINESKMREEIKNVCDKVLQDKYVEEA